MPMSMSKVLMTRSPMLLRSIVATAANATDINPVPTIHKLHLTLRKPRIRYITFKVPQQHLIQKHHYSQHYFKRKYYSSSSVLNSHSNSDDKTTKNTTTGSDHHKEYLEQINELEKERTKLFGDNTETTADGTDLGVSDNDHDLQKTIEQMNREREELYDFTPEEKVAWGNINTANNFGTHSSDLMNAIEKAKETKALYEDEVRRETESRVNEMVQGISKNMDCDDNENVTGVSDENNEIFTHLNKSGEEVSMVDVGDKTVSKRIAVARSTVLFPSEVMQAFGLADDSDNNTIKRNTNEVVGPKGPIFATARLAGIMGAKRTSDLIPLCHPLPLSKVHVEIKLEGNRAVIECECRVTHKTGVEMEALAGATVAALTIYDMVKAVSHNVQIESTYLVKKSGGKRKVENKFENTAIQ